MNVKADLVVILFTCQICETGFTHVVPRSIPDLYKNGLVKAVDSNGHPMTFDVFELNVFPDLKKEVEQDGSGKET